MTHIMTLTFKSSLHVQPYPAAIKTNTWGVGVGGGGFTVMLPCTLSIVALT